MMWSMVAGFDIGAAKVDILGVAKVRRNLEQISEIFPAIGKGELKEAIRAVQPGGGGNYLDWCFNSVLIRIPDRTILVDTGFGFSSGGPGQGTARLLDECGVRPEDVDTVLITHGHGDHIGGLTEGQAPAFPGARVVISRQEFDFWMEGEAERILGAGAAAAQQSTFSLCRGQIECIEMDSPIAESADALIRTLPSPGHTPGHIGVEVRSQAQRLWLLVDTLHALFQLKYPHWSPRFDVDTELARTTRLDLLRRAARLGATAHLYHFPFPGLGTVAEAEQGFAFKPADA